mmetsp:Transcript_9682/g.17452  ORF Transcript_9682/g.17452 Transcript_9682/m.17452 type:complete len:163 (-) Transcript_9682:44-532(-)
MLSADDLHSNENREKMRRGEALTDKDRFPWLDACAEQVARVCGEKEDMDPKPALAVVLACSALKLSYRERLRMSASKVSTSILLEFVLLSASQELLKERLRARRDHFMNPSLLQSQLNTLELPSEGELHCRTVKLTKQLSVEQVSDQIAQFLSIEYGLHLPY